MRSAFRLLAIAAVLLGPASGAGAQESPIFSADDDGVTLPVKVSDVRAVYTQATRDARIEGIVRLECVVRTDGSVDAVRVTRSLDTTYGLDDAARDAVLQWMFRPGTRNGEPVAVRMAITIRFVLD